MIQFHYTPLRKGLAVAPSTIAGHGIHALRDFPIGYVFGISHYMIPELIRTPLGGFLNHADEPNAQLTRIEDYYVLEAIKPILALQELTVYYSLEQSEENKG